jgi:hypothetical protein
MTDRKRRTSRRRTPVQAVGPADPVVVQAVADRVLAGIRAYGIPHAMDHYVHVMRAVYPEFAGMMKRVALQVEQLPEAHSLDPMIPDRLEQENVMQVSSAAVNLAVMRVLAGYGSKTELHQIFSHLAFDHLVFGLFLGQIGLAKIQTGGRG